MRKSVLLRDLAHARSGDKGSDVNIGVIARSAADYQFLRASYRARQSKISLL